MEAPAPWYYIFTFVRDGITGSELLGMVLMASMIIILFVVQYGERRTASKVDFAWIFMDSVTDKVSRSGLMTFGGFVLGSWLLVDAQSNGKLDWGSFMAFLSYCAGVRVIEKWKPAASEPQQSVVERTTKERLVGEDAAPPAPDDDPKRVFVANREPIATREVPANPLKKKGGK